MKLRWNELPDESQTVIAYQTGLSPVIGKFKKLTDDGDRTDLTTEGRAEA